MTASKKNAARDVASAKMLELANRAIEFSVATTLREEGDAEDNRLRGTGDSDTLIGGGGDDKLFGDGGDDILYGDLAEYVDFPPAGDDRLFGGNGDDMLIGGILGNDRLIGGAGDDVLVGGLAVEVFNGAGPSLGFGYYTWIDSGIDFFDGGAGYDIAYVFTPHASTEIDNRSRRTVNTIVSGDEAHGSLRNVESLVFYGGTGDDLIFAGQFDDQLYGDDGENELRGGAGDDILSAGLGNDRIDGGAGDDTMVYNNPDTKLVVDLNLQGRFQNTAAFGRDFLTGIENVSSSSFLAKPIALTGDARDNHLRVGGYQPNLGVVALTGNGGEDVLEVIYEGGVRAGKAKITLDGGADDDVILFRGDQRYIDSVRIIGGAGEDKIIIEAAGNAIVGAGDGNDLIQLDILAGTARVTLGAGKDTLELTAANIGFNLTKQVEVTDFKTGPGGDVLSLDGLIAVLDRLPGAVNPFGDGHLRLRAVGTGTALQVDKDGGGDDLSTLLIFSNTNPWAFTAENFGGYPPGLPASALVGPTWSGDTAFMLLPQ